MENWRWTYLRLRDDCRPELQNRGGVEALVLVVLGMAGCGADSGN